MGQSIQILDLCSRSVVSKVRWPINSMHAACCQHLTEPHGSSFDVGTVISGDCWGSAYQLKSYRETQLVNFAPLLLALSSLQQQVKAKEIIKSTEPSSLYFVINNEGIAVAVKSCIRCAAPDNGRQSTGSRGRPTQSASLQLHMSN